MLIRMVKKRNSQVLKVQNNQIVNLDSSLDSQPISQNIGKIKLN